MQIFFDEQTLKQDDNPSRSITAGVYFGFDAVSFPSAGWSDFVVVIAAWWLEALQKLEHRSERKVELNFMDGPYWISVESQGDTVLVQCVEDRPGAGVVHTEAMSLSDLTDQVVRTAGQVLSACRRQGISSSDVTALATLLATDVS